MSEKTYEQVVGEQAVEFERRLREACFRIYIVPSGDTGWTVTLVPSSPKDPSSVADGAMLAEALWRAANAIGLTSGLNPPAKE